MLFRLTHCVMPVLVVWMHQQLHVDTLSIPNAAALAPSNNARFEGYIQPRTSNEISSSMWSIGVETQDRNYTIYRNFHEWVGKTGAKRGRLQGGWQRCDPNGTSTYNWDWLDESVWGLKEQGLKPWIELSYGNSKYPNGGEEGPGAGLPNSTAALEGWSRWAYALGQRYANATNEFEVWNEPSMSLDNADLYAELCVETCVALYDAFSGHDQTPLIYIGALSGGYSTSGIPFIAKTFAKMTELLTTHSNNIMETTLNQQKNSHQLTLADCVGGVTFHAYASRNSFPDGYFPVPGEMPNTTKVASFVNAVRSRVPSAVMFQGEAGAPAVWMHAGAMEPQNWTETLQLKWDLRSMLVNAAHQVVQLSSVFTLMDICYDPTESNVGFYGLLAATCNGTHPDENKTVDHVRPAFRAVQTVMSLFDDDVVALAQNDNSDDYNITFTCSNGHTYHGNHDNIPKICHDKVPASSGFHCDLNGAVHLPNGHVMTGTAAACRQACCDMAPCDCWTFSTDATTAGCWLMQQSVPLQPKLNCTAGQVIQPNPQNVTPIVLFSPVAYLFRNHTREHGVTMATHVALWNDALRIPNATEAIMLPGIRCNVSIGKKNPFESQDTTAAWSGTALQIALDTGEVYALPTADFAVTGDIELLNVELTDTPLLIVRDRNSIPSFSANSRLDV